MIIIEFEFANDQIRMSRVNVDGTPKFNSPARRRQLPALKDNTLINVRAWGCGLIETSTWRTLFQGGAVALVVMLLKTSCDSDKNT